jgi:hypothetical protein
MPFHLLSPFAASSPVPFGGVLFERCVSCRTL